MEHNFIPIEAFQTDSNACTASVNILGTEGFSSTCPSKRHQCYSISQKLRNQHVVFCSAQTEHNFIHYGVIQTESNSCIASFNILGIEELSSKHPFSMRHHIQSISQKAWASACCFLIRSNRAQYHSNACTASVNILDIEGLSSKHPFSMRHHCYSISQRALVSVCSFLFPSNGHHDFGGNLVAITLRYLRALVAAESFASSSDLPTAKHTDSGEVDMCTRHCHIPSVFFSSSTV